jgi:hypothetical protein
MARAIQPTRRAAGSYATTSSLSYSTQRHQHEYVERIFNKVEGTYVERCYDPKTGEITFEKEGPITDQSLHGRRGRGS